MRASWCLLPGDCPSLHARTSSGAQPREPGLERRARVEREDEHRHPRRPPGRTPRQTRAGLPAPAPLPRSAARPCPRCLGRPATADCSPSAPDAIPTRRRAASGAHDGRARSATSTTRRWRPPQTPNARRPTSLRAGALDGEDDHAVNPLPRARRCGRIGLWLLYVAIMAIVNSLVADHRRSPCPPRRAPRSTRSSHGPVANPRRGRDRRADDAARGRDRRRAARRRSTSASATATRWCA